MSSNINITIEEVASDINLVVQEVASDINITMESTAPTVWGEITGDIETQTDLINIIPIATSDLTNDSGFITIDDVPTALSELTDDSTHRLVTDTEKGTWNGKQDALGYTPENAANKVTAFQSTPDNTHYPSEKLIKDSLDTKASSTDLTNHTLNTSNPHSVTASQVGLGNVDNTSDLNKPISTSVQSALNELQLKYLRYSIVLGG